MIPQYNELAVDLGKIRRFLGASSQQAQTVDQRRFAYIACISALYASFENFAERVAFRFSEMLLSDRANLTDEQMASLRRRYVRNASALLGQSLGVGRYREITELDVAKSLLSFLDESSSSLDLRLELMTLHGSNLRWEPLTELFSWAIQDLQSKIRSSDAVKMWASGIVDVNDEALNGVLKSELDDLVERRNEVAHRAIPDEILSPERLLAKVDFVEAVSLGLAASLAGKLLEATAKSGALQSLGTPSEYYQNNSVVVIPLLQVPIRTNDCVLVLSGDSARWGHVLEVRVEDVAVQNADAGIEVGLRLDFAVQKGKAIHRWPEPEPELLPPPKGMFGKRGPL